MVYRDSKFYDKESSLALVLLRDIPNQWHFSGERSLQAPVLCLKGHCDLMSRYSEAQSRGPGHLLCPRRPLMCPVCHYLGEVTFACPPVFPAAQGASAPLENHPGLPSVIQTCEVANCSYLGNSLQGVCPGGRGSGGQMWEALGASEF